MNAILKEGRVVRGWLGVEVSGSNPMVEAGLYGDTDPSPGVVVMGLIEGGPAARAGVQVKDRILTLNGQAIRSASQLIGLVAQITPDTSVPLVVQRGKDQVRLSVTIAQREARAPAESIEQGAEASPEWFTQ